MKKLLVFVTAVISLFSASFSRVCAQDVVISEFQAKNNATVTDNYGGFPDWIELYNAGDETVDLSGWFLTDDAEDLAKWRFPAVSLDPGEFLLVYASDKDLREPDAPLHANFRLNSSGEYLALVAPDGATIVHDFGAAYPPQPADYSYGLAMNGEKITLAGPNAAAKAFVPVSSILGLNWTFPDFNDSAWREGATGVGYDRGSTYDALIDLDMQDAMYDSNSTVYIRIPFFLENAEDVGTLSLRMQYDDGFIAYINGEEVASAQAPASPAWNSVATADHPDSEALIFQHFSIPASPGLLRNGDNMLAIHGLNRSDGSSDMLIVPELDAYVQGELESGVVHYFDQPSPGYSNSPGFPEIAERPVISPEGTVFEGELEVTLSIDAPDTEIRYTLDGSDPSAASALYSGPITIDTSTLVRAQGMKSGLASSPVVSMGYIAIAGSTMSNFSSDIPVVIIENFGEGRPPKDPKEPAFMAIFEPGDDGRTRLIRNDAIELPALRNRIGIEVRGSSTAGREKASFSFEFRDEDDDDIDFRPLGLPEESDWILYGAYNFDRALMRNPLIYELSNQTGRYAARTKFIELFFNMNGGDLTYSDYMGVYSFMEKIKRGEWRVDIEGLSGEDNEEPAVTGGYIMKVDRNDPGDSGFSLSHQGRVLYYYPKEDAITSAQTAWIRSYMQEFEDVLFSANFKDPVNGYAKYVDTGAWIDHHILNILPMNVDAIRLSGYFHKNRGGKIEYGPIWDFDRTMGSTDGRDDNPRQWDGTGDSSKLYFYSLDSRFPWWYRLFQDDDFMQCWIDRWFMLRETVLSTSNIHGVIDGMQETLDEAHTRNFQRWTLISASYWYSEVTILKNWLASRVSWMDSHFIDPPEFSSDGGKVDRGFELSVVSPSGGTIYYTLDGSDPREPGGDVAPQALTYTGDPIVISENTRVCARVQRSNGRWPWSAPREDSYIVDPLPLVITEIMYHPGEPPAGSPYEDNDYEFIELFNRGSGAVDLSGVRFSNGVEFSFAFGTVIDSGAYALVVKNLAAFMSRYPATDESAVLGEYSGSLENRGERIVLSGEVDEAILDLTYDDLWFPSTDGFGYSIVLVDPMNPADPWNLKESWRPSGVVHGSPGSANAGGPGPGGWQLPGDMNQDGALDLSDAITSLLYLFSSTSRTLPCEGATLSEGGNLTLFDVNGDLQANLADVVYTLRYLFNGGAPPSEGIECILIQDCPQGCGY